MTEVYPPSARVRRRADYRRIQASRSRTHTRHFLVVIVPSGSQRFGVTVTKKIGNAVVRNRALFPLATDIVFIAKQGAGKLGYADVLGEVSGIRDSLARQRDRLGAAPAAPDARTEASS